MKNEASIFHETVLAIAQAEQRAPSKKEIDLVFPNELPKHPANAHLVFWRELFAGIYGVFKVGKGTVANGLLPDLVAKVDKRGARCRVVALNDDLDNVFQ